MLLPRHLASHFFEAQTPARPPVGARVPHAATGSATNVPEGDGFGTPRLDPETRFRRLGKDPGGRYTIDVEWWVKRNLEGVLSHRVVLPQPSQL